MIAEKIERINTLKSKITELSPLKEWDNVFFEKVKADFTYKIVSQLIFIIRTI